MKRTLSLAIALIPSFALAQTLTVTGGKADARNVVVRAPLPDGMKIEGNIVAGDDRSSYFLVAKAGLMSNDEPTEYLTFLLTELKAGEIVKLKVGDNPGPQSTDLSINQQYRFHEEPGQGLVLTKDYKAVLRLENAPRNEKDHYSTFKPFHHVYAPSYSRVEEPTLLTAGVHPNDPKQFLFPHHRGLFFGFNRITYGDNQTADIWHGTKNVYSQCDRIIGKDEWNLAFGRHRAAISWHGSDGKVFANEEREVTARYVYHLAGRESLDAGIMIDWASALTTKLPKVRLDGDPQHAGFHFRANQDVAMKAKAETYYVRPDGIGKKGEFRNWDAKGKDPKTVNLPWDACSFVLNGKRYTALRINHPDNPKETRGSERDYGRFGDYFEYDLTPEKPLKLKYRVWVQEGEMTGEQCAAMAAGFAEAPAVKLAK